MTFWTISNGKSRSPTPFWEVPLLRDMMSSLRQSFIKETASLCGKGRGICLFYQLDIIGAQTINCFLMSVVDCQNILPWLPPQPAPLKVNSPVSIFSTWLSCTVYWSHQTFRWVASGFRCGLGSNHFSRF